MAHMWNLKNFGANDLIYKTEIESQMWITNMCTKAGKRDLLGDWD